MRGCTVDEHLLAGCPAPFEAIDLGGGGAVAIDQEGELEAAAEAAVAAAVAVVALDGVAKLVEAEAGEVGGRGVPGTDVDARVVLGVEVEGVKVEGGGARR